MARVPPVALARVLLYYVYRSPICMYVSVRSELLVRLSVPLTSVPVRRCHRHPVLSRRVLPVLHPVWLFLCVRICSLAIRRSCIALLRLHYFSGSDNPIAFGSSAISIYS